MKANELRDLSIEDLQKKTEELNQELFNLRFQLHTMSLTFGLVRSLSPDRLREDSPPYQIPE